jgi:hypothetical protein
MLRQCLVASAFAIILASTASASVILSENFDELTPTLDVTSAGAFSTINNTFVDIDGGSIFGRLCVAPESGNCIDMAGAGGSIQGQLQSNMLFPAGTYLLSFDLIGSQRGHTASTTVTFGNYSKTFTLPSSDVTDGIVVNQFVTLSSPGYLLFVSHMPGEKGDLLDNVVVSTAANSSVPEPSSFLLLGLALLLSVIVVARRKRNAASSQV